MNSSAGNRSQPPSPTEIEVSVFGPGFGESIALHLGEGIWAIVDSCIAPDSQEPTALEYLRQLQVDVAQAVRLVIATHWHDDHVRGLGAILRACPNARFFCSAAMQGQEIMRLIERNARQLLLETTGVSEFAQVVDELRRRQSVGQPRAFFSPEFAIANLPLWPARAASVGFAEIRALSPSSAAMAVGQARISELAQERRARRLPALTPNHASVVLWVRVGGVEVLLGSDLEERSDPGLGWSAILQSPSCPSNTASAFKTAHHGSSNGEQPAIWTNLLAAGPVTVTTPFVHGRVNLPEVEVARRICERSSSAFLTAFPLSRRSPRRSPAVERTIRESVRWIRQVQHVQGHVRLRREAADPNLPPWTTETFGAAVPLEHFVAAETSDPS